MNREQARNLVQNTFPQKFNKGRFEEFVQNLLNHIDGEKAFGCNSQYVKDAFKDHVRRYERLGTYTAPDNRKVDILVVHLTGDSKLTRARTALRNFVADYLKQRDHKDAALVAFVSPSESAWRFSYVKMEYATTETPSGNIGVEARLTPARRFSYLVGPGESCHTAQARFLELLQNTQSDPPLAQIEEAFSVEAVTKEFFERYKQLFIQVKEELDKLAQADKAIANEFTTRKVGTANFAKKLMGQIVFLYFLQKKGWLGVPKGGNWGDGPHDFLRKLAKGEYAQYRNLFNDILEPLFYDTLATDRGHEVFCERFKCRIPFLNGGLFEPLNNYDWRKTEILLPNRLFTNNEPVEEGITGTGILDVFDRYNFTVNEAEPLEKEVAIDPEMLGKVFENLLGVKERKSKGSFYTPREIVHYMCQESLINYLDITVNSETALVPRADIETLIHTGDQAAHYEAARISGTKSYEDELPKSIQEHARHLDAALAAITVCDPAIGSGAFPVGMMQEIVRARSALTPYFNDAHERTAYHFKRHAIQHCLYGVDIDPGAVEIAKLRLWLSLVVDEEETKQIKPLPNLDYKVVVGNSLLGVEKTLFNEQLFSRLEELKPKYFDETNSDKKHEYRREIDQIIRQLTHGNEAFDFEIYFSEVFRQAEGFNVVIGNPPYLNSRNMAKDNMKLREIIQASYSMTKGSWDIYIAFFEKGFDLLGSTGSLAFITPDKWISKPFGDELRVRTTDRILSILRAGRGVFESATVDAIVSIYVNRPQPLLRIYEYVGSQIRLKSTVEKCTLEAPYAYDWLFSSHRTLLAKLEAFCGMLSQLGLCENSCATDDAYRLRELVQEEPNHVEEGQYLRMINTGTIGKYTSKWGRRRMVYLGRKYLRPAVDRKRFLNKFPNSYGAKSGKMKIILKGLNLLDACLDPSGSMVPGIPTLVITADSLEILKILLAIVNSPVAFFYIREKYPGSSYNQGTTFTKEMINNLPVPKSLLARSTAPIKLVDQILTAKAENPEADASALESEIDQLVYQLYNLTPEEIAIVEGTTVR